MSGAAVDRARVHHRTVRVLVAAQVLGGAATGAGAAVSPLLAKDILGSGTFAGLAFASLTFGAALCAIPLSRKMARSGRRPGLVWGYALASAGAAAAIVAADLSSFPLLLGGMLLFGAGNAANLLSRYAGADLAEPDRRARGIATVMWATTVGAVAGPNVLGPAGRLAEAFALPSMAGPYLMSLVCFVAAGVVIWMFLRPDPLAVLGALGSQQDDAPSVSVAARLRVIARSPVASVGLTTMAVAHGVMVSVMTMTPLHLRDHGGSLEVVGVVISLHIAGMYAFAPIVGVAADRFGHFRMAQVAATTLMGATLVGALAGHSHAVIALALILLGLGWSMATIAGATLLTDAVPAEERAATQGIADMTMGVVAGTGGTVAGIVVGVVGYPVLSAVGTGLALALLVFATRTRVASGRLRPTSSSPTVPDGTVPASARP